MADDLARVQRSTDERIKLIRHSEANPYVFEVSGTTGNVYTVNVNPSIRRGPTCACKDYEKRHRRCKHIYFVLCRCLGIPENIATRSMTKELLDETLVRRLSAHEKNVAIARSSGTDKKRKPFVGEECAICLQEMNDVEETVWCSDPKGCGKSVHLSCFWTWMHYRGTTCVNCRAKMTIGRF